MNGLSPTAWEIAGDDFNFFLFFFDFFSIDYLQASIETSLENSSSRGVNNS